MGVAVAKKDVKQKSLNDSILQTYFNDMRRHPLLTAEEEQALARTIQHGGIEAGAARNRFISANLRFVVSEANRFYRMFQRMPLLDLIQEGNIGLIRAIEKFNPEMGFRFSTYARWWIWQAMTRSSQTDITIRIPHQRLDRIHQVRRVIQDMNYDMGRHPTLGEISHVTGLSETIIKDILLTPEIVTSIDSPIREGDARLENVIEDSHAVNPETGLLNQETSRQIHDLIREVMSERDTQMFIHRFGLDGGDPMNLKDIGNYSGVSRERVRQIIARHIPSLRHLLGREDSR